MAEPCRRSGELHDFHMASRKAEEAALRRYQAVHWLECFVGPIGISSEPSEREFISCLRNGIILCNVINKIKPGSVVKVVENHLPVQSESVIWDSQPLPAYQYFENVRNFLVAVRELNLPSFEATDLERENFEAGSAVRIAECILALKSYHEWKEWSGGNGVYKHVTAKSPFVLQSAAKKFSQPLGTVAAQPCRRLDMSNVDDKQSLTDSIVKALTGHMVDSKENISDNFLTSLQNGNQDPVQMFSELLSRCLEEKLRNKYPGLNPCSQDISREANGSHTQPALLLKENVLIQNSSQRCKARSGKGCDHLRVLESQERDLSDIKVLWSQAKREFENLQSQLFNDLKHIGSLVEEMSTPARGYQKVVQENRKLYNMVQDLKGNIRVYCKIRPIMNEQTKNVINVFGDDGSLVVVDPTKTRTDGRKVFQFNQVYGPMTTLDELFKDAQPLIRSVMDGYHVCILAYGQTGSGKTHTMYGPTDASAKEMGINFFALNDLFQMANSRRDIINYEVCVQMVEICNEEIRDLLAEDSAFRGESGLPDITMHSVKSNIDAINLVKQGQKNRIEGFTAMNNQNAHSHSVVAVHVHGKDASGNILRGCLHMVDLAGSREVDNLDKCHDRSLSTLEEVMTSLSQRSSYIPYRNSKLTSFLQDALGGHAKILMFAHVNPEGDNLTETISTLKFAQRVSTVELGAAHSNKMNSEVMELKEEIEILKRLLGDKDTQSHPNRQVRSPCEKAKAMNERTPPRSRRLSMENSGSGKTDNLPKSPIYRPRVTTESTPQKSLRKSIETPSTRKTEKVQNAGASKTREPKSPNPEGSVPRSRRLSIENPIITRSEKAHKQKEPKSPCEQKKILTNRTPPRTRRLSIENPNSMKSNVESRKGIKTPPLSVKPGTQQSSARIRRLSLEAPKSPNGCKDERLQSVDDTVSSNETIGMMEAPKSPLTNGHVHQPMFTDCAAKFPSLQAPRTPEQQKLHRHEMQATMHPGINISVNSQTPGIVKSTNGKGSHIRKSLRTIGKLINGSEKRNQQKMEASSIKVKDAAVEAKSPPISKAKVLRRQSLTGIPLPGSDRRSSLGGMSTDACPIDNRNAKTPPSVRSSTKITKRWM